METERLIIDEIRETDKEDYFHNISHDKAVLENFVCPYTETIDDLDFSPYLTNKDMYAIRLKDTKRLIGIILFFDAKEDSCEIGYGIGTEYWNKGYVSEALNRFIDFLFNEKDFKVLYASYFPQNIASKRVMEKCGMKFDHLSKLDFPYLDKERDLIYYSIRKGA